MINVHVRSMQRKSPGIKKTQYGKWIDITYMVLYYIIFTVFTYSGLSKVANYLQLNNKIVNS